MDKVNASAQAMTNLFEAADIIIQERLKNLKFDKSIICKIVDASEADKGEYMVDDGSTIFKAYSEKNNYSEGISVYVTIPNGDFSQQKMIVGKYVENNDEYYTYKPPSDTVIDITDNIFPSEPDKEIGIRANGKTLVKSIGKVANDKILKDSSYDKIVLKTSFKTFLKKYNLTVGTFGFLVNIVGHPIENNEIIRNYSYNYSSANMFGDYYNYNSYYPQEIVFDISQIGIIESIELFLYQNADFASSGTRINPEELDDNWDIFISKDIYLSLGYTLDEDQFLNNPLRLYTLDSLDYTLANPDDERNTKDLQIRWIVKQGDGFKTLNSQQEAEQFFEEEFDVHWYRYTFTKSVEDDLVSPSWKEESPIDNDENSFTYLGFKPDINKGVEQVKVIIEKPTAKYVEDNYADYVNDEGNYNLFMIKALYEAYKNKKDINYADLKKQYSLIKDDEKDKYETYCNTFINNNYQNLFFGDGNYLTTIESNINNNLNQELKNYFSEIKEISQPELKQEKIDELIKYYNSIIGIILKNITAIQNNYLPDYRVEDKDNQTLYDGDINKILSYKEALINKFVKCYESKVLQMENVDPVPDYETMRLINGVKIECDIEAGGLKGVYRIYNSDGTISSVTESSKKRKLYANYSKLVTGIDKLDTNETISWYIPLTKTMIFPPQLGVEYENEKQYKEYIDDTTGIKYAIITRNVEPVDKDEDIIGNGISIGDKINLSQPQVFRIKDLYNEQAINNTVRCVITQNGASYESSFMMTFGTRGTAGTYYTFTIQPKDGKQALVMDDERKSTIQFETFLYDAENNIVADKGSVKYDLIYESAKVDGKAILQLDKNGIVSWNTECDKTKYSIEDLYSVIIQAQCQVEIKDISDYQEKTEENKTEIKTPDPQKVILIAQYPLAIAASSEYVNFSGPTTISYSSSGLNPQYYKEDILLFKTKEDGKVEKLNNVTYNIKKSDNTNPTFYPGFSTDNNKFTVPKMFMSNCDKVGYVIKENNKPVWVQSLLIYQNAYDNALLNQWDGSLQILEDNGVSSILANTIGAGQKDSNNRFSGTLMGVVKTGNTQEIGLFGYHEGVQSFGFKHNGTAFIGKSGKGRIVFNGNTGTIGNKDASPNKYLDLNFVDGKFESVYEKNKVVISPKDDANVFKIEINSQTLMKIGENDYFLQSLDFGAEDIKKVNGQDTKFKKGFKLDLANRTITGYDAELNFGYDENYGDKQAANFVRISSQAIDTPINVGNKFKVGWDGSITSTKGMIGGWNINENYLGNKQTILSYQGVRFSEMSTVSYTLKKAGASTSIKLYEFSKDNDYSLAISNKFNTQDITIEEDGNTSSGSGSGTADEGIIAETGFFVQNDGTAVMLNGNVINSNIIYTDKISYFVAKKDNFFIDNKKLGELAFANNVSVNFNITVTGIPSGGGDYQLNNGRSYVRARIVNGVIQMDACTPREVDNSADPREEKYFLITGNGGNIISATKTNTGTKTVTKTGVLVPGNGNVPMTINLA